MRSLSLVAVLTAGAVLAAQDNPSSLPSNYSVQFENAWVKVTAVRYGPLEKLAGHAHTPNPSAYVYLNDGPPVRFRHIGGHNAVATRPATKAGAFRVYRGLVEVHEVENTGESASEFLRVELKTQAIEPDAFRGKFERPAVAATDPVVHVDHPQVRISRVWVRPGEQVSIAAPAAPALVIALGHGGGFTAGQSRWVAPSTDISVVNTAANAIDFLRFDFRTPPSGTAR
jgi:hypothetical protein